MERSPEFSRHLEEVRKLPQRTDREKAEKQEQAKLLRMEALLENAHLAQLLIRHLEYNPGSSPEEFEELAGKSGSVIHPEVVSQFIKRLKNEKSRVIDQAGEHLKVAAESRRTGLGRQLYEWALPLSEKKDWPPKLHGMVTVDRSYPLALILYVSDQKDFERIDRRKNVGGFYTPQRYYPGTQMVQGYFSVPFIAVNGIEPRPYLHTTTTRLVTHEKGHAENQSLIEVLKKSKKAAVWGRYEYVSWSMKKLEELWNDDPEKAKKSWKWKHVLEYALAHAKDELLAEYKSQSQQDSLDLSWQLNNLMQKEDVYDYFANHLGIEAGSPLYNALWQEYEATLKRAVGAVRFLISKYKGANRCFRANRIASLGFGPNSD